MKIIDCKNVKLFTSVCISFLFGQIFFCGQEKIFVTRISPLRCVHTSGLGLDLDS